jgi:phosphocarrier protein FPr
MSEVELEVGDPSGLHARPAAAFVAAASAYQATIRIENVTRGRGPVSAKSVISVLGLGVSQGHRVRIAAEGADAEDAVARLARLVAGERSPAE